MTTQTNAARPNKPPQKSNQQKNGVRFALATAATIVTLLGAQTLAFTGKADAAQSITDTAVQQTQTTAVALVQTSTATAVTTTTDDTQVMTAASQPNPTTKSSR